jgi:hypothetical protein
LERQKLETTVRHRALAEVLKRIGAPLERADLALVASTLLDKLDPLRKELLARRHKLVEGTASEVTHPQVQQAIARMLRQPDEGALSKLLIEDRSRFAGMHRSGAHQRPGCTDRNGQAASRGLGQTPQSHRAGIHREACETRGQTKEGCEERFNQTRSVAYCEPAEALGNRPSAFLCGRLFSNRQPIGKALLLTGNPHPARLPPVKGVLPAQEASLSHPTRCA